MRAQAYIDADGTVGYIQDEPVKPKARRGTTNRNDRGSAETRRRRKAWLIETYRADQDLSDFEITTKPWQPPHKVAVPLGSGEPACRCYRCGRLLDAETVTVDRIKPGCEGGTYRRDNIRPACSTCNEDTGRALGNARTAAKRKGARR